MIFDQNSSSLYGPSLSFFGLGFGWTDLSAASVVAAVRMVCATITLAARISGEATGSTRIGGTLDLDPRISGTPGLVEC